MQGILACDLTSMPPLGSLDDYGLNPNARACIMVSISWLPGSLLHRACMQYQPSADIGLPATAAGYTSSPKSSCRSAHQSAPAGQPKLKCLTALAEALVWTLENELEMSSPRPGDLVRTWFAAVMRQERIGQHIQQSVFSEAAAKALMQAGFFQMLQNLIADYGQGQEELERKVLVVLHAYISMHACVRRAIMLAHQQAVEERASKPVVKDSPRPPATIMGATVWTMLPMDKGTLLERLEQLAKEYSLQPDYISTQRFDAFPLSGGRVRHGNPCMRACIREMLMLLYRERAVLRVSWLCI